MKRSEKDKAYFREYYQRVLKAKRGIKKSYKTQTKTTVGSQEMPDWRMAEICEGMGLVWDVVDQKIKDKDGNLLY